MGQSHDVASHVGLREKQQQKKPRLRITKNRIETERQTGLPIEQTAFGREI